MPRLSLSMQQHNVLRLCSKVGRHSLAVPPRSIGHHNSLVHPDGHSPPVTLSPRSREHTGRPIESNSGRSQGIVTSSGNCRLIIPDPGNSKVRSVCVQTECQALGLLLPVLRQERGFNVGWVRGVMSQIHVLCIPRRDSYHW